ncbi:MAG TPA: cold shock domain-containing protein [Aliidongia sp.]|nr:cold shock domain-containing protein [Aliidongia sp.]
MRPSPSFGSSAPSDGPIVDATVKWFNAEKGFGFTELADGSGDAFLHIGALQAAGRDTVLPGAKLRVQVGHGAKGAQVSKVLEIDDSTAAAPAPRSGGAGGFGAPRGPRRGPDPSTAVPMAGTVKWFNRDKGFGFVASEDGGKDVFVHISVLHAAGLADLAEGQPVSMRVAETPKGREAVSVELAG